MNIVKKCKARRRFAAGLRFSALKFIDIKKSSFRWKFEQLRVDDGARTTTNGTTNHYSNRLSYNRVYHRQAPEYQ